LVYYQVVREKLTTPLNPFILFGHDGILRSRHFYTTLISLSFPIMLQNLLASSLSFVDTLMIGQLGEIQIAAVGLANQMFFLVILLFFGISSGSSIFFSQFWGSRDLKSIHKTLGLALIIGLTGAGIITAASIAFPASIMRIFTPDPAVIAVGTEYLRIVGISYMFTAVTFIFSSALRSTGNPRLPLLVSAISMTTNAIFNYLLIFGKFGFPQMGVRGAAIATVGSRALEVFLILFLSYRMKKPTAAPLREFFAFDKVFTAKFVKTVTPVILNEMAWSLGMVMYKIVFARMGTSVIASVNVTEAIQSLFFVVFIGTGNGSAIMIGNKIGEKRQDLAHRYAGGALILGFLLGGSIGIIMSLLSPVIPLAFRVSPEILAMTTRSLALLAILMPFKTFNMHSIVGVLRSGGDTRFSLILELTGVWFVGVPLALIGGLLLQLPIYWLYLLVGLEEIYKMLIGIRRIRSGKWLNDLTGTPPMPSEPQFNSGSCKKQERRFG
jgi:putative MATE family efflux protein